jgi:hypothetical protein
MYRLFKFCRTREERIQELYQQYHRASIEGKSYVLWGLYALDAKQFRECKKDFLKAKKIRINRIEGCIFSTVSCEEFLADLEGKSKKDRMEEIMRTGNNQGE